MVKVSLVYEQFLIPRLKQSSNHWASLKEMKLVKIKQTLKYVYLTFEVRSSPDESRQEEGKREIKTQNNFVNCCD